MMKKAELVECLQTWVDLRDQAVADNDEVHLVHCNDMINYCLRELGDTTVTVPPQTETVFSGPMSGEWTTGSFIDRPMFTTPLQDLAGTKHDGGKARLDLLSPVALTEIAKALAFGANKYGDFNYRKGFKWSRLYAASMRHLLAHMGGEDLDKETGLSHLAHAACTIMFLIDHEEMGLGDDDRYQA